MAGTATIRPANMVIDFALTAPVGAGLTVTADFTCLRPFDIVGAWTLAGLTQAASTARLAKDVLGAGVFTNVTAALAMDTVNTIVPATSIVYSVRQASKTDVLRTSFTAGGGGTADGHLYAQVLATPITGAA